MPPERTSTVIPLVTFFLNFLQVLFISLLNILMSNTTMLMIPINHRHHTTNHNTPHWQWSPVWDDEKLPTPWLHPRHNLHVLSAGHDDDNEWNIFIIIMTMTTTVLATHTMLFWVDRFVTFSKLYITASAALTLSPLTFLNAWLTVT